ncbi:hypothetical protein [Vreelandella venusta]|uniref:hypothetical protein n=1 Tax=Vreelandella venusta TaxID=44935 RepID=UPI003AA8687D
MAMDQLYTDSLRELEQAKARIAELEQERDAYRTAEEAQIALRQKMEQERDMWAAQLDRPSISMIKELMHSGVEPDNITTSLARRDALKQAEWISSYLRSLPFNTTRISPIDLNIEAKKLLREAEAHQ